MRSNANLNTIKTTKIKKENYLKLGKISKSKIHIHIKT